MNKLLPIFLKCSFFFFCSLTIQQGWSAILPTYPATSPTTGGGGISFELTVHEKLTVEGLSTAFRNAGTNTIDIYYRMGGVQVTPGISPVINSANGWILLGSVNATAPAAGNIVDLPLHLPLHLPPGKYGFFLNASDDLAYQSWFTGAIDVFTDGKLTIETGHEKGYGGAAPSPSSHPRQFVGEVVYSLLPDVTNNAGVTSIDSPAFFCAGTHQIMATVENTGNNQINNIKVNWRLDGVLQPQVTYSQLIDTLGGTGSHQAQVSLGMAQFLENYEHTVEIWVSEPNGTTDPVSSNDTLRRQFRAALSGNYKIDPFHIQLGGVNFKSFFDAIEALEKYGICAPVTFNVKEGVYHEQNTIRHIKGSSSHNTVTFRPSPVNSTAVEVKYTGTAGDNYVLRLKGSCFINLEDIKLTSSGAYTTILRFEEGAHHHTVKNCQLIAPIVTTAGTDAAVVYLNGEKNDFNIFEENYIYGGSYGLYYRGGGIADLLKGVDISGNRIEEVYNTGIYLRYTDAAVVRANKITSSSAFTSGYGIYSYYGDNGQQLVDNVVRSPGEWPQYALRLNYADGLPAARGLVANNMLSAGGVASVNTINGLYVFDCVYLDVIHNNVAVEGTSVNSRAVNLQGGQDVRVFNNNFIHYGNGYAVNADPLVPYDLDYNNLAGNGTYLARYDSNAVDLAAWKAMRVGQHSISDLSVFIHSDSLRSCSGSLYQKGHWLGYPEMDIDGEQRNGLTPCIGADEFVLDPAYFEMGDTLTFCQGVTAELGGNIKYGDFLWSNGATTSTITVSEAGIYHATVEACVTMTDTIEVIDLYPEIDFTFETSPGEYTVGFTNLSSHVPFYAWDFGDGDSASERTTWHRYDGPGSYMVSLTVGNECDTLTLRKEVVISEVGILDPAAGEAGMKVFPNPAREQVRIVVASSQPQQAMVEVYRANGSLQYRTPCMIGDSSAATIDLSQWQKGIYLVKVILEDNVISRPLIIY